MVDPRIQSEAKKFFGGASNNERYNNFRIIQYEDGTYEFVFESPGDRPGNTKIYMAQVDANGELTLEGKFLIGPEERNPFYQEKFIHGGPAAR